MEGNQHQHHHKHSHGTHVNGLNTSNNNEMVIDVSYEEGKVKLHLADVEGKPTILETTHEKTMHLIIVSNDLEEFYHLHPEQINMHEFVAKVPLAKPSYTVFVDINPKGIAYTIQPHRLNLNSDLLSNKAMLNKESNWRKEVNGRIVELVSKSMVVNEPVTISFQIENGTPQPYLGALGHVVIIDQEVEQFLHVHPISEKDTAFHTQFDKSGLYKLWVEFRFEGTVEAFPFVIEVPEHK
ncbi:hypothetical protein [Bacillus coreaensis]